MTARVGSPGRAAAGALQLVAVAAYETAGTFAVAPPIGARCVRITLRGGGGGGGGNRTDYGTGGRGGGEGALQRRLVAIGGSAFQLVVGAGGAALSGVNGAAGGASSILGFVAMGGAGGSIGFNGALPGPGGVGANGAEPKVGHGSFSGSSGHDDDGGGLGARTPPFTPTLGAGGHGAASDPVNTAGQPGASGYCLLEFYR